MSAVEDNNINFQNLELKLREKFAQLQFKEVMYTEIDK